MRYYFQLSAEGKSQYTSQHIQTSVQKLTVCINHCQKAIAEKTFALFKCRVWSAVTCIQYKQNYRHLQVHSIKVCKGHSSHYISTEASFCLTFCPTLWCQKELSWGGNIHRVVFLTCLEIMPGIFSGPAEDEAVPSFSFITGCVRGEFLNGNFKSGIR